MLTREDYKTYIKLKTQLLTHDKEVQTDFPENTPILLLPFQIPQSLPQTRRNDIRQYSDDDESEDRSSDESDENDSEISDSDEGGEDDMEDDVKDKSTECDDIVDCIKCDNDDYDEDYDIETEKKSKRKSKNKSVTPYLPDEKAYYKNLPRKKQKIIDTIENEILDINLIKVPIRFRILESDMDTQLKAVALNKLDQLNSLDPSSGEYCKLTNWIENFCKLPIGKYKKLPINNTKSPDDIREFLDNMRHTFNSKVYGHTEAKDQFIRLLAKWISNPNSGGLVIGLEGSMGTGKTCLCNAVCESLGFPFGFVQLGGISDGSYLLGHSYTFEGSRWGRIAEILMKVGCMNPVLYFDELDKVSDTRHGEEIINILIHLTDSSQNSKFHDKYFSDIELDLSKCLIIFSYNHGEFVNPILRDRMITIKTDGYNLKDKLNIAKDYLLPAIKKEFSFNPDDLVFTDEIISYIITITDEEQGVRNLKRSFEEIISQINLNRLLKTNILEKESLNFPLIITNKIANKFLIKKPKNVSLNMMYI